MSDQHKFVTVHEKTRYSFIFLRKLGFSITDKYKKRRIECRKQNCIISNRYDFTSIWPIYFLARKSTKSAPLNGHYPKLQFPTCTWFSHAQSHFLNLRYIYSVTFHCLYIYICIHTCVEYFFFKK